jgi:hypothetical protein
MQKNAIFDILVRFSHQYYRTQKLSEHTGGGTVGGIKYSGSMPNSGRPSPKSVD